MRAPSARLLFFTAGLSADLVNALADFEIDVTGTGDQLIALLTRRAYDVIVLDERILGAQMAMVAATIKHRYPLVPLIVMPCENDAINPAPALEQNTDEILPSSLSDDESARFIRRILNKYVTNRAILQRNERLQTILGCTRMLHNLPKDQHFIANALDLINSYGDLYGTSLALMEREILKVHTVRAGGDDSRRYHEHIMTAHEYNPFLRVMESGIITVYEDINVEQHYLAPPVIPEARAAAFLPLRSNKYTGGALAIFRAGDKKIDNDELQYFELLADHVALALQNLASYDTQRAFAQTSELLLKTWEVLTGARSESDLLRVLRALAQSHYGVRESLIWMYGDTPPMSLNGRPLNIHADEPVGDTFVNLFHARALDDVIDLVHQKLKPVILWRRQYQGKPLDRLFDAMGGEHLILLPLSDAARVLGLMVMSIRETRDHVREVVDRLETLMHISGQALERMAFIDLGNLQSRRAETLFDHIPEAVIFVAANGHVEYANEQVSALLNVNADDLIGRDGTAMLRMLADSSDDPAQRYGQLTDALKRLLASHGSGMTQIDFVINHQMSTVRLVATAHETPKLHDWAIIVQSATLESGTAIAPALPRPSRVAALIEQFPAPQVKLREIVGSLSDYSETTNKKIRSLMMRSLEYEIEKVGLMWNNLIMLGRLEANSVSLEFEPVDANEVVQMALESRFFRPLYRRCRVNHSPQPMMVEVDLTQLTHALISVINYALDDTPSGTEAVVDFIREDGHVVVQITNEKTRYDSRSLSHLLELSPDDEALNDLSIPEFGIVVSRSLIEAHGGTLEGFINPNNGLRLRITLVAMEGLDRLNEDDDETLYETNHPKIDLRGQVTGGGSPALVASTPRRDLRKIAVFKGTSLMTRQLSKLLDLQGYDLTQFTPDEVEALRNMRASLIIVDAQLDDDNPLSLYRRLRLITSAPVVIVGDQPLPEEKVEALNLGVEDYITSPIGTDELSARVSVIVNRSTLPDRTREPFTSGALMIDFARRQVYLRGEPVDLTRLEYDLLHTLATNVGQVLSHQQLLTQVWGPEYRNETQYLWVNIRRLRQKIEPDASNPHFIRTKPRSGYYFHHESEL